MSVFGKGSRELETIVGDGTRIAGEVTVKGTVRIDGIVEGDVNADWVVVGESGRIRGNTRTRGIVVAGTVEGNIYAAESVELSGRIVGVGRDRHVEAGGLRGCGLRRTIPDESRNNS